MLNQSHSRRPLRDPVPVRDATRSVEKPESRPRILIVDDERQNINILNQALKDEYQIRVASNGAEALLRASSHPRPDIILLDIVMPVLDGFQVCQKLQADANTADIPVIFVSARKSRSDVIRGLKLGGRDFISRPVHPEVVRTRVSNLITRVQRDREEALLHQQASDLSEAALDGDSYSLREEQASVSGIFNKWQEEHGSESRAGDASLKKPDNTVHEWLLPSDTDPVPAVGDAEDYYIDVCPRDSGGRSAEQVVTEHGAGGGTPDGNRAGGAGEKPSARSAPGQNRPGRGSVVASGPASGVRSQTGFRVDRSGPVLGPAVIVLLLLNVLALVGVELVYAYTRQGRAELEDSLEESRQAWRNEVAVLQQRVVALEHQDSRELTPDPTREPDSQSQAKSGHNAAHKPAADRPPDSASDAEAWGLVLKSVGSRGEAEVLLERYRRMGLDVVLREAEYRGITWYRIGVENLGGYTEAERYARSLNLTGGLAGARLVRQ